MAARVTTALHLAGWVLAAILGHAALVELDALSPLSVHDTVVALEWDAKQPCEKLNAELDGFAHETGIVIGKAVPGQEREETTTTVFLYGDATSVSPGIPGAPVDGYSAANRVSYRDADELGLQAPIGSYYVYGTDSDAARVAEFLGGRGFTVNATIDSNDIYNRIEGVRPDTERTAHLIGLVIAVAAGGAALMRRREHGVAFLQGLSWRQQLSAHARGVLPRWALAGVAVSTAAAAWLYTYNGGQGWLLYLGVTAGIALALLAVDMLVTAMAVNLLSRLPVTRSLAGALPVRTIAVASIGIMIATALLLMSSVSQAADYGADLQARSDSLAPFDAAGDAVALATTSLNREVESKDYQKLTSWLSQVDRDGDLILAGKDVLQGEDPSLAFQRVLYVNDRYLEEQPIRQADGDVVEPAEDEATVMIPSALWESRDRIMKTMAWDFLLKDGAGSKYDPKPVRIRDGSHFTYSTTQDDVAAAGDEQGTDSSRLTNPVVVSFPSQSGVMSPMLWSNAANGEVVFPEPAVVEQALESRPELNDVVLHTSPIAGAAQSQYLSVSRHFQSAVLAVVLSAVTLVATSLLITYLYSRTTAQWTFAHHLHGRGFIRTHRWFFLVHSLGLAVMAAWIPIDIWRLNREFDSAVLAGAAPATARAVVGPEELTVVGGTVVLIAATVATATALAHRRIVRHGCHEA